MTIERMKKVMNWVLAAILTICGSNFQWTGDRLESIQTTERSWVLTYDDNQHIINARLNRTRLNYAYEYDAQGRLARMVETMPYVQTEPPCSSTSMATSR